MTLARLKPEDPQLSRRELLVYRALLATTSSSSPETTLSEFALRIGLGKPTHGLWHRLTNLERKKHVAISALPQAVPVSQRALAAGGRELTMAAASIRLRPLVPRDEALDRYFTKLFADYLSFDDDRQFLAALSSWAQAAYVRQVGSESRDDADRPG